MYTAFPAKHNTVSMPGLKGNIAVLAQPNTILK